MRSIERFKENFRIFLDLLMTRIHSVRDGRPVDGFIEVMRRIETMPSKQTESAPLCAAPFPIGRSSIATTNTRKNPNMAIRAEIKCINKTNRQDAHDRIHSVGGVNPDGARWKMSQQDAVVGVDNKTYSFYVRQGVLTVEVITATSRYGHRYLKTERDNEQPDNLLSLPECL